MLAALVVFFPKVPYINYFYKDNSGIIFEKSESWGPCPSRNCSSYTALYESGKLVKGSKLKPVIYLEKEKVARVKDMINSTNIMNIECSKDIVLDYYAKYTLKVEGKIKVMYYPECEEELEKIEGVFLVE